MSQDEIAAEDLERVRADPQKYANLLGTKRFVAMYPELADEVTVVKKDKSFDPDTELPVTPDNVAEHALNMKAFESERAQELTHVVDGKGNEFPLRRIPNEPDHGKMIGRLDPTTGKAVIEPASPLVQGAFDAAQDFLEVEKKAQAALQQSEQLIGDAEEGLADAEEKDERMLALHKLIRDEKMNERGQVVAVIMAYAEDCEERAEALELSGARERKRLRKTGHVKEAEQVREMQVARSAAFKVRAAISADLAYKIETGWGRKEDGSVQDKPNADDNDVMKEAARLNREAAHLKTV